MEQLPVNRYIDHAVLKPEMTRAAAVEAIKAGLALHVRTVCVRPCDIALAGELCRGSDTEVCTVLAFPHGDSLSESKADEAARYVDLGADEIDMVANYGLICSGEWAFVEEDIRVVSAVTKPAGVLLKVILETSALNADQIARATKIAAAAGADFVKTSTGFTSQGATEDAVRTMLKAAAGRVSVKASGGIRDRAAAVFFLNLGCKRLGVGCSSTAAVCGK